MLLLQWSQASLQPTKPSYSILMVMLCFLQSTLGLMYIHLSSFANLALPHYENFQLLKWGREFCLSDTSKSSYLSCFKALSCTVWAHTEYYVFLLPWQIMSIPSILPSLQDGKSINSPEWQSVRGGTLTLLESGPCRIMMVSNKISTTLLLGNGQKLK